MPRLFVAIELPESVKRDLQRLCAGVPGARWATPDQLHLTLRFVGEVDGARADDIAVALAGITGAAFSLTLDGLGHFFHGHNPHTLWAGVRAEPALLDLQARIDARLQRLGLAPERRNYAPHVTIARLKKAASARLADYMQSYAAFLSGPFDVAGFALFSSFLSRNGAIYTIEASYPLGQPAHAAE